MKTYIWTLPTRIFHWLLVIYIAAAYITADEESYLNIHASIGYGIGVLVLFRIIWGFIGPKYSRFAHWPLSIKEAISYVGNIFNPIKSYPGHNPAASFAMVGMIAVAFMIVISGVLTYGIQEGRGVLSFLNTPFYEEMELFEEMHELFANILLVLIAAHLAGVATDRILHAKSGTLGSMINGYKNIDTESARLNLFQKAFASIMLSLAILIPLYAVASDSKLTRSIYHEISYQKEHPLFAEECASCHILYPPHLLPKVSWQKMMSSLEDHFGDDASLERVDEKSIEEYLVSNSAETSTKEAAFYIFETLKDKEDIIAISESPYWKEKHKEIDDKIYRSKEVKTKANCKACHGDIEKGLLEDMNIKMPTAGAGS